METLKHSKTLRGTNIWIDEDFTKESQMTRKALLPQLKEATHRGHRTQLKYNKLIVNEKAYGIEDLQHNSLQYVELDEGKNNTSNIKN